MITFILKIYLFNDKNVNPLQNISDQNHPTRTLNLFMCLKRFKWNEIKDLNSFTWRSRLSLSLSFISFSFPHSLIHSLNAFINARESEFFLFIDLFYIIWNQFRAAFLFTVARLPFPLESLVSLSPLSDSKLCIEKQIVHTIRYLLSAALKARASERWMGKLNWKHILLGIWSITQLIMTFFFSVFIRDFLFSRCPDPSVTFSLSLANEFVL